MTERDFLRSLDATISGAFSAVGMASAAVYTTRDGDESACTVMVDHDYAATAGGLVQLGAGTVAITIFRADVESPAIGDYVTIDGTGERYRLTGVVGSDQSARVFTAAPEAMEA